MNNSNSITYAAMYGYTRAPKYIEIDEDSGDDELLEYIEQERERFYDEWFRYIKEYD